MGTNAMTTAAQEDDPVALWARLHRLEADATGPNGESWCAIATKERMENARLRAELATKNEQIEVMGHLMDASRNTALRADEYRCKAENELAALRKGELVCVPSEPNKRQIEEGEILLRVMLEERTSLDVRLIYSAMLAAHREKL